MNKRLLPEKRISEFFPNANTKKKKVERSKIPKNVKDFLSEIVHVEKLLHTNSDANIFNFNDETEKKYKKKNSKRGRKKTPLNSVIYRVPSPELISTKNIDNPFHSIEPFPSPLISISPKLITRSPSKSPSKPPSTSSSSSSSSSGSYSPFRKLSKETLRKIVKDKKKISHKPKGLTWEVRFLSAR